ncbi:MAG: tRNA-dihydrouridine synthase [Alphaproteobacteria bacterium]|nr:tRNA-dihydrouridine synthase [Alphaproteobacteria bacterium]
MFSDNQIFAAPLAGITDRPFRRIMREFSPNAPLVTEMISCHSLVGAHKNCLRNFDNYTDEGNVGAQIFGADVSLMADAARILADAGAKWIDINMGCPVPKVATRAGAGAHLMRDHALAGKIMHAVVRAVDIPVSVKTRLGWDDAHRDWADLVKIAADCGVRFATLHGRTRAQLYVGPANLPVIDDSPIRLSQMVIFGRLMMCDGLNLWGMPVPWWGGGCWDGHGLWRKYVPVPFRKILATSCCDIWNMLWNTMGRRLRCLCSENMPHGTVRVCQIRPNFVSK